MEGENYWLLVVASFMIGLGLGMGSMYYYTRRKTGTPLARSGQAEAASDVAGESGDDLRKVVTSEPAPDWQTPQDLSDSPLKDTMDKYMLMLTEVYGDVATSVCEGSEDNRVINYLDEFVERVDNAFQLDVDAGVEEDNLHLAVVEVQECPRLAVSSKKRKREAEVEMAEDVKTIRTNTICDGYDWSYHGKKLLKRNKNPKAYYRCKSARCCVKKHVQRCEEDTTVLIVTYFGNHNHPKPTLTLLAS